MTHRVRRALQRDADEGFGLAETLAALLIFTLVSLGLLHSILSILSISRDSRARQVAINLAAQEVDRAREKTDLFDLLDDTATVDVDGHEFTVRRTSQWVSDPSVELQCGGGGGILRYKRINVEVTWAGMRPGAAPVRTDTVLNPDDRINDPQRGTIIAQVTNGDGDGVANVNITATPTSGGGPVAPTRTDAQGCAYMLMVEPGDYRVAASASGHVDVNHEPNPRTNVTVTQGAAAPASFQYDRAAGVTVRLVGDGPARLPSNLDVSFVSTYNTTTKSGSGDTRTYDLHPFASGYSAYAGTCPGSDPAQWTQEQVGSEILVGRRVDPVAAPAGGAVSIDVPVVNVGVSLGGSSRAVRAESVDHPGGLHPTCDPGVTLSYGNLSGGQTLALPYGTWRLTYNGSPITPTALAPGATVVDGLVVVDPRVPEPMP